MKAVKLSQRAGKRASVSRQLSCMELTPVHVGGFLDKLEKHLSSAATDQ